ncbi:putative proline-rich transmembrane protein 1 [Apostichopus japonicus]|uniref:Putative proline-rich transmembrane protein 1 n=1 Tax=Stichopus japonicus TaxID=307972 RepID=A0A2G8K0Q1_STIJA|nr:putative proline-rich transmembrane protein 1 [Apostichopus japonicus]
MHSCFMWNDLTRNPPHNPAYPPPQQGSYPMQPNQPGGGAPPPYYQPPAGQQYPLLDSSILLLDSSILLLDSSILQSLDSSILHREDMLQLHNNLGRYCIGSILLYMYVITPLTTTLNHKKTVIVRQTQIQPNDYLGFAIFVTICCCLPFGIVGIIKATEVRSRFISGDYQGAEDSSRSAKNWSGRIGDWTDTLWLIFLLLRDSVRGDTGGSSRLLLQLLLATVV